ncbi:hypothetical protein Tco_0911336 [Tanacetum coccineum]|uniref:Uncharacterized protein n=1 Tax=Tanacetum coccineum TaxID=301880 RepID=A0ABQ5CVG8_9ASTR
MGYDHITRQYTQSKKVQWLKQKMMFAQLQEEAGIQLSKEQLAILADAGERVDSGLDCDEVPIAQANFMKNLSSCDSKVLYEVRISHKSQENNQKRANTDTRIRRVQSRSLKSPKP